MRAPKTIASRSSLRRSAKPPTPPPISKHAEELMELAVEAAQSRHLPDFLEQFALRATRMLDAIWGGVAVFRARDKRPLLPRWHPASAWLAMQTVPESLAGGATAPPRPRVPSILPRVSKWAVASAASHYAEGSFWTQSFLVHASLDEVAVCLSL